MPLGSVKNRKMDLDKQTIHSGAKTLDNYKVV